MMRWYAAELNRFGVPVQRHHTMTRAGKTHVITAGHPANPALVLLHGINVSALGWRRQIERLSAQFYVVAPDIIGFSGLSAPIRYPYHGHAYSEWLYDVIDAHCMSRPIVIGSSGGGWNALQWAVRYPQRTAGLILLNPCGIERYPYPNDFFRCQIVVDALGWLGRRFGTRAYAERLVRSSASRGAEIDLHIVEMAYILMKYFRRYRPPDPLSESALRQISAPVLLMMGEAEPYFDPRSVIKRAQRTLANLHIEVLAGGGHDIHNDRADHVAALIAGFAARDLYTPRLTHDETPDAAMAHAGMIQSR